VTLPAQSIFSSVLFGILTSCGNPPEQNVGGTSLNTGASGVMLTVDALAVQSGAPRMLGGAIEIRAPRPGEQSVESNGNGGACLLAQVPVRPKSCTVDKQCDIVFGQGKPKWGGYCLSGTCWIKPSESYCLKRVGEGSHSIAPTDASEVYAYAATHGEAPPISWRVLGCLNGVGINEHTKPGCVGPPADAMHDAGDPTPVP
jgi:hypothetical protein